MAITAEQRSFRSDKLGSSDAVRIMDGRWREVWAEKTGRTEPADLDLVPAVQIGIATEPLHARFYAHRTGLPCLPAGDRTLVHPILDFLVAHPDFLTWRGPPAAPEAPPDAVLEAKFHAGMKSDAELVDQYYWQLQHQMLVGGFAAAVLSVLRPTRYSFVPVARSEADQAKLVETLKAFWWHVVNDVEPDDSSGFGAPDFDGLKVLNMARHNQFVSLSSVLIENRRGFASFREAELALKALMPGHARIAYVPPAGGDGRGVVLMRARDGKLTLRFGDLPRRYWDRAEPWAPDGFDPDADGIP